MRVSVCVRVMCVSECVKASACTCLCSCVCFSVRKHHVPELLVYYKETRSILVGMFGHYYKPGLHAAKVANCGPVCVCGYYC